MLKTKLNSLNAAPICFGGASLSSKGGGYGFGAMEEKTQDALLERAFELGIKFYDSAPIYGFGKSEEKLGATFSRKRDEVIFISKSGVGWHDNQRVNMSNDPKLTQLMLEDSLRRFNCEYIDLYMIHWPDANVDIRRPLEVLSKAQEQGKIHHIGLCNSNESDYAKALTVCKIEALQNENNLFHSFDTTITSDDVLTMGWGSFDKGILSGRVDTDRKFDQDDCRSWAPWWKKSNWKDKVKFVQKICKKYDLSMSQLKGISIEFAKNVDYPIFGFSSPSQLEEVCEGQREKHKHYNEIINEFSLF